VAEAVEAVDAIILDCSGGGNGLEWEVRYLATSHLLPMTIILAETAHRADLERNLASISADARPTVLFYGPGGLLDPGALLGAVLRVPSSAPRGSILPDAPLA
jgi:hypothetical protein